MGLLAGLLFFTFFWAFAGSWPSMGSVWVASVCDISAGLPSSKATNSAKEVRCEKIGDALEVLEQRVAIRTPYGLRQPFRVQLTSSGIGEESLVIETLPCAARAFHYHPLS